jgi:hypothetical protein
VNAIRRRPEMNHPKVMKYMEWNKNSINPSFQKLLIHPLNGNDMIECMNKMGWPPIGDND